MPKSTISYACDTIGNVHIRQGFTENKRCFADTDKAFRKGYRLQLLAAGKRACFNGCHPTGDRHGFQCRTMGKQTLRNFGDAVGKVNCRQRVTIIKGIFPKTGHAVRESYTRQIYAIFECGITNAGDAFRHNHPPQSGDSGEGIATLKGMSTNGPQGLRKGQFFERRAVGKGIITDGYHTVFQRDRQNSRPGKGILGDVFYITGDRHRGNTGAVIKGVAANGCKAVRQGQGLDVRAVFERPGRNPGYSFFHINVGNLVLISRPGGRGRCHHGAGTADAQCSVGIQHPCQGPAAGTAVNHIAPAGIQRVVIFINNIGTGGNHTSAGFRRVPAGEQPTIAGWNGQFAVDTAVNHSSRYICEFASIGIECNGNFGRRFRLRSNQFCGKQRVIQIADLHLFPSGESIIPINRIKIAAAMKGFCTDLRDAGRYVHALQRLTIGKGRAANLGNTVMEFNAGEPVTAVEYIHGDGLAVFRNRQRLQRRTVTEGISLQTDKIFGQRKILQSHTVGKGLCLNVQIPRNKSIVSGKHHALQRGAPRESGLAYLAYRSGERYRFQAFTTLKCHLEQFAGTENRHSF